VESKSAEYFKTVEGRKYLGVSVHHLGATVYAGVTKAVQSGEVDGVKDPAKATIWHAVQAFAKPQGASKKCPRDGNSGAAYVDLLKSSDDVGPSTAFLSYTWYYTLADTIAALDEWIKKTGRDPQRTYVWMDALCLNQHRISEQLSPELVAAEFGPRVEAIGRILPMLHPWDDPVYTNRAWCLFELYTAIQNRKSVDVDIIITPSQREAFLATISSGGYSEIDAALASIKAEDATATMAEDLEAIKTLVKRMPGGFPTLNETVQKHLRQWFESQGAVQSSGRLTALGASALNPGTTSRGSSVEGRASRTSQERIRIVSIEGTTSVVASTSNPALTPVLNPTMGFDGGAQTEV
jgi:hypothetical protein